MHTFLPSLCEKPLLVRPCCGLNTKLGLSKVTANFKQEQTLPLFLSMFPQADWFLLLDSDSWWNPLRLRALLGAAAALQMEHSRPLVYVGGARLPAFHVVDGPYSLMSRGMLGALINDTNASTADLMECVAGALVGKGKHASSRALGGKDAKHALLPKGALSRAPGGKDAKVAFLRAMAGKDTLSQRARHQKPAEPVNTDVPKSSVPKTVSDLEAASCAFSRAEHRYVKAGAPYNDDHLLTHAPRTEPPQRTARL
ncbi:hypothetical protein M885DRAFT_613570 [Pelagophyceae sp. CCMP2097]|nr:hypothetical protein M885DRAFT_613570 [Pelagophyceae sp. CCMP2097]